MSKWFPVLVRLPGVFYDVASRSEIMPCIRIYKPLVPVSRFAMENPWNPRLKSTEYSDGVFKVSMAVDGK